MHIHNRWFRVWNSDSDTIVGTPHSFYCSWLGCGGTYWRGWGGGGETGWGQGSILKQSSHKTVQWISFSYRQPHTEAYHIRVCGLVADEAGCVIHWDFFLFFLCTKNDHQNLKWYATCSYIPLSHMPPYFPLLSLHEEWPSEFKMIHYIPLSHMPPYPFSV